MKERLSTIFSVVIVTLLIWLFAEAESVKRAELRPEIQFTTDPGSDLVVRIAEGQPFGPRIDVQVQGSPSAIDAATIEAAKPVRLLAGLPGIPNTPGEHTIDLRDALREYQGFRNARVTIARVQPASVRIEVDRLASREVPVVVDVPGGALDGPAEVVPAVATVRVPARALQLLPERFTVTARVEVGELSEGKREVLPRVPLVLPPEVALIAGARVDPPAAQVSLRLRSRTASHTIPSVPVQVRIAPSELDTWSVQIPPEDRFLTDVRVTGPRELIEQIRRGDVQFVAYVPLTFRDLEQGIRAKDVSFGDLPSQVQIETAKKQIRLTITKRTPAADAGARPGVPDPVPAPGPTPGPPPPNEPAPAQQPPNVDDAPPPDQDSVD